MWEDLTFALCLLGFVAALALSLAELRHIATDASEQWGHGH